MGLEINIRAVINLALLLVCLCPQGQRSIRVQSQCCLVRNKNRRDLLEGCVPGSTKNFESRENGTSEDVEKTTVMVLHKDLNWMFI